MPCDTIQTYEVNLGKVSPKLMVQAIEAMGIQARLMADGHTIRFSRSTLNCETGVGQLQDNIGINQLKRAYSMEVVKTQAKRFGWNIKKQQNSNQLLLQKGAF